LLGNGLLIGTGSWGRLVVTLAGAAAAAVAVCAPAFVLVVFVPARAFLPICVVPAELPIELPNPPAAAPLIIPTAWLLIPVCGPPFIPVCAPTFVLGVVLVPLRKFVPVWTALEKLPLKPLWPAAVPMVAEALLLPLAPVRGVCARLNVTVAMQITINPSLIDGIWVIIFSLRPTSSLVWATSLLLPRTFCSGRSARLRTWRIFRCYRRDDRCSLVRDRMQRV